MLGRRLFHDSSKIGFIGLGNMGKLMSLRLLNAYPDIIVYDKEEKVRSDYPSHENVASDLSSFANCDYIFTMLPDGNSTKSAILSDSGLKKYIKEGSVIINTATIGVSNSKYISGNLDKHQIGFIDAPVSGGTLGAKSGTLTFLVGGSKILFEKMNHLFKHLGKEVFYLGDIGKGQAAKICNNMLLAINVAGVCEALNLANDLGLDLKAFNQVLKVSSGRSWVTDKNIPAPNIDPQSPSSRSYSDGFSSSLLLKDINLALEEADKSSLKLHTLKEVRNLYSEMISKEQDSSKKDMGYLFEHMKKTYHS